MSGLLFIGSTCADVVVRIPHLPVTGEDLHVSAQQTALGGCACNAFQAARLTGLTEPTLFSPVGTGAWGEWVRRALAERGVVSAVPPVDAPNGCCYCMVEDSGERTFLSHHGAEYLFRPEWFEGVRMADYDGVYLCGLEVEESTGDVLIDALTADPPRRLYFAPGPRILRIAKERLSRIYALHPVLHLNEDEALRATGCDTVPEAARALRALTGNEVIITLGERGAYALNGTFSGTVPGFPAQVVDTIGAGDAHIGVMMAAEAAGFPTDRALTLANRVSAAVVAQSGAELSAEAYRACVGGL